MQVLLALVAIAAAQLQVDCKLDEATSLLQVSSTVKTRPEADILDAEDESVEHRQSRNKTRFLDEDYPDVSFDEMRDVLNLKGKAQEHAADIVWDQLQAQGGKNGKHSTKPIDFVYCWSGEDMQQPDPKTDIGQKTPTFNGYGFNEMEVSFESIRTFAPWFHKVYVLVNGPAKKPKWAEGESRFQMIDRCSLFPKKSDCPTTNIAACQSVAHRIPGLKEQWVFMEDDFMVVNKVYPSSFFSRSGKPFLTSRPRLQSLHTPYPFYETLLDGHKGWDIPPVKTPYRIHRFMHRPVPMLTSFSWFLENEYPEWHAFVRSHKKRFACCNASHPAKAYVSEDFITIWPAMLLKHNQGVKDRRVPRHDPSCRCTWLTEAALLHCLKRTAIEDKFAIVEDCTSASKWNRAKSFLLRRMRGKPKISSDVQSLIDS